MWGQSTQSLSCLPVMRKLKYSYNEQFHFFYRLISHYYFYFKYINYYYIFNPCVLLTIDPGREVRAEDRKTKA